MGKTAGERAATVCREMLGKSILAAEPIIAQAIREAVAEEREDIAVYLENESEGYSDGLAAQAALRISAKAIRERGE